MAVAGTHEPPQPQIVVGLAGAIAAVGGVIGRTRNELAILSCRLEPVLYGDQTVVDALRRLALRHERVRIRILVNEPDLAMRRAHRLVEFARRVTSRIQFRQLPDDQRGLVEDWAIADSSAVWHRDNPEQLESRLIDSSLEALLRLRRFDPLWESSVPARALMELHI
ncbi:hypothetical protein AAG565_09165 [Fontimonas sp. SYSU GA230001]|uniref:DUF7931 domain-containing protein n=1 Tax=Fontimonas sp. SYSU GA230001 TaxID=3142450 RepID=UPI0032B3C86A